jgi:hypothetical protein
MIQEKYAPITQVSGEHEMEAWRVLAGIGGKIPMLTRR